MTNLPARYEIVPGRHHGIHVLQYVTEAGLRVHLAASGNRVELANLAQGVEAKRTAQRKA